MEQCVALVDYAAGDSDEISFRRGDVITVTAKGSTSGFWEGFVATPSCRRDEAMELRGLFPNCFVSSNLRPQQTPTFCDRAVCLHDYKAGDASEMSFRRGDLLRLLRPSASQGWWFGVNESKTERMRQRRALESEISRVCGTTVEPRLLPSNFVSCNVVLAAFSFEARHSHELRFEVGDVILVHRRWNDGWWEGTLQGHRGIFPSNYTLPNMATTAPPFFCNTCKSVLAGDPQHCGACAKSEEVTQSMIAALDDYSLGKLDKLDMFAYVDVDETGAY